MNFDFTQFLTQQALTLLPGQATAVFILIYAIRWVYPSAPSYVLRLLAVFFGIAINLVFVPTKGAQEIVLGIINGCIVAVACMGIADLLKRKGLIQNSGLTPPTGNVKPL